MYFVQNPAPPSEGDAQVLSAMIDAGSFCILAGAPTSVRLHILRHARIKTVGKSESCMVSDAEMGESRVHEAQ